MIVNPLQTLDEMLVECEHLPDMAAQITALRIWHLNDAKRGTPPPAKDVVIPTKRARPSKDVSSADELAKAEIDYALSHQRENESDIMWRRRRDRLRHKVRRIKEKMERDGLPPLVKTKKDKWSFGGIGSTVTCPHCQAQVGKKCRNMTGGGIHSKVAHPLVPANSSHKRRKEAEKAEMTRAKAAEVTELVETTYDFDSHPKAEPSYSVLNA